MVDDKNSSGENNNESDAGNFDEFSKDYLESCKEQIEKLTQNPAMLEKALAPFMKMQRDYMENPDKLAKIMEGGKSESDEITDSLRRIRARLARLEKRLEESGVLKPINN